MSSSDYFQMFEESERARIDGRVVSIEDLEKEIEKW
jgi:hypothetical protein